MTQPDEISKVDTNLCRVAAKRLRLGVSGPETAAALDALADRLESPTPAAINPQPVEGAPAEAEDVDRFDPGMCNIAGEYGDMDRNDGGDYVLYDDYATLARQLAEAKSEIADWRNLLTAAVIAPRGQSVLSVEYPKLWPFDGGQEPAMVAFALHTEIERTSEAKARAEDVTAQLAQATARLAAVEDEAATERALQRAAGELPIGWEIRVVIEPGSGWVELYDPEGNETMNSDCGDIAEHINAALDAALQPKEPTNEL